jgi:hypothetical protein
LGLLSRRIAIQLMAMAGSRLFSQTARASSRLKAVTDRSCRYLNHVDNVNVLEAQPQREAARPADGEALSNSRTSRAPSH